ncbi:MAG: cytochrome d ubiquinol oxidase subunit II [Armatimonadetes bacterium]|nr:cytochrome d ubiquinol oxidase subunit II [Armatimonadota bacterium]
MRLEELVAGVALLALIAYALLGGADFGGGVWDLLVPTASGRAEEHRVAITRAMGPVWEANHVWLIFVIVLLFTGFPAAYTALSVALFVPLHLALLGIVLRGAAFVFRSPGALVAGRSPLWMHAFRAASILTPLVLGMCLGAISAGRIRVASGRVVSDLWRPWLAPFPVAVGVLALAVSAYLAAVYLTVETEGTVQEDFRRRALGAGAVTAVVAGVTLALALVAAPRFWGSFTGPLDTPIVLGAVVLATLSAWAVYHRRYHLARVAAAGEVVLLLLGWGLAQYPYLIYPHLTLWQAASLPPTLRFILWTLVPGGLLLVPSLWFLFTVFKGRNPTAERAERGGPEAAGETYEAA